MIKKNRGFTLMEVLLAIGILAASSYILSGQQVRSLLKLRKSREFVERIYLLKQQLYLFLMKPPVSNKPQKIEREVPAVKIVAQRKVLAKQSSLARISSNLYMIEAVGTWQGWGALQSERMISFVYAPQAQEKKS